VSAQRARPWGTSSYAGGQPDVHPHPPTPCDLHEREELGLGKGSRLLSRFRCAGHRRSTHLRRSWPPLGPNAVCRCVVSSTLENLTQQIYLVKGWYTKYHFVSQIRQKMRKKRPLFCTGVSDFTSPFF